VDGDGERRGTAVREHDEGLTATYALILIAITLIWIVVIVKYAHGHDIYTNVHGKDGALCCGGSDCASTVYRENGDHFEFLTREGEWVEIPEDRITFLPIPGDPPSDDAHHAHICYRPANESDKTSMRSQNVFGNIYLYCVFIPPGGI
jgi:hypothetical protein